MIDTEPCLQFGRRVHGWELTIVAVSRPWLFLTKSRQEEKIGQEHKDATSFTGFLGHYSKNLFIELCYHHKTPFHSKAHKLEIN